MAQIQKSDVTLSLSVDTRREFKSSPASIKTNVNQYTGCDVTVVASRAVIALFIYRPYAVETLLILMLIFLLSFSDTWMEEFPTTCLSTS